MKHFFLALLCSGCTFFAQAQLLNSGMMDGNSFLGNVTGIGSFNWTTPANAKTENNGQAAASVSLGILGTATTRYISAQSFGNTVPDDAVIDGIKIRIKKRAQGLGVGCSIKDEQIKLMKGGTITGRNYASTDNWTGTFTYVEYGDDTTKWGSTWTAADVNSTGFGVVAAVKINAGLVGITLTAQIDHIQTIVFYHMPPVALPVELMSFTASSTDDKYVQLDWATALEVNNDYFSVERSGNGFEWESIAQVSGMGNSTVKNSYSYVDDNPESGANYYRLKQHDYDGAFEYSPIVSATVIAATQGISLSYISASGQLRVRGDNTSEPVQIKLYDLSGRLVDSYACAAGQTVQIPQALAGSVYVCTASAAGKTVSQKIYR